MMEMTILWDEGIDPSVITIPIVVSAHHVFTTVAPTYPTEKGASRSEHVYNQPTRLQLQCLMTGENRFGHWQLLQKAKDDGALLALATPAKAYETLRITSLDITETVKISNGFSFTMSMQEVLTVDIQTSARKVRAFRKDVKVTAKVDDGTKKVKFRSNLDKIASGVSDVTLDTISVRRGAQ